ncbi:hypothetical protein C7M84_011227 [Penaeus vannamei]|uniref:Uncharacterized protein n=1 Tax=Penaeus vannamei TaxID=6689 RepID=A0A423T2L0_PENVA|nr:hypothetical protein C7M84_011227 [Penaeus vannamei]
MPCSSCAFRSLLTISYLSSHLSFIPSISLASLPHTVALLFTFPTLAELSLSFPLSHYSISSFIPSFSYLFFIIRSLYSTLALLRHIHSLSPLSTQFLLSIVPSCVRARLLHYPSPVTATPLHSLSRSLFSPFLLLSTYTLLHSHFSIVYSFISLSRSLSSHSFSRLKNIFQSPLILASHSCRPPLRSALLHSLSRISYLFTPSPCSLSLDSPLCSSSISIPNLSSPLSPIPSSLFRSLLNFSLIFACLLSSFPSTRTTHSHPKSRALSVISNLSLISLSSLSLNPHLCARFSRISLSRLALSHFPLCCSLTLLSRLKLYLTQIPFSSPALVQNSISLVRSLSSFPSSRFAFSLFPLSFALSQFPMIRYTHPLEFPPLTALSLSISLSSRLAPSHSPVSLVYCLSYFPLSATLPLAAASDSLSPPSITLAHSHSTLSDTLVASSFPKTSPRTRTLPLNSSLPALSLFSLLSQISLLSLIPSLARLSLMSLLLGHSNSLSRSLYHSLSYVSLVVNSLHTFYARALYILLNGPSRSTSVFISLSRSVSSRSLSRLALSLPFSRRRLLSQIPSLTRSLSQIPFLSASLSFIPLLPLAL